ncbi:hypothetical protein [Chondromyces apiculatus]|nr:hypothetical protein [Chondromyces apiculatus]
MRPLSRLSILLALLTVGCVLAACGGATFNGTVYRGEDVAFRIPQAPPGWQQIEVSHTAVAFRDEANMATIAINGRCRGEDDVPLAALTQHLFLQFSEREILSQEVVPFDGREAMHTVLQAKLDGVAKKFDVWVLKKDGCVYDLLLVAHPARFEADLEAFGRIVRGFATLSTNDS